MATRSAHFWSLEAGSDAIGYPIVRGRLATEGIRAVAREVPLDANHGIGEMALTGTFSTLAAIDAIVVLNQKGDGSWTTIAANLSALLPNAAQMWNKQYES